MGGKNKTSTAQYKLAEIAEFRSIGQTVEKLLASASSAAVCLGPRRHVDRSLRQLLQGQASGDGSGKVASLKRLSTGTGPCDFARLLGQEGRKIVTVKDVEPEKFIGAFSQHLKRQGGVRSIEKPSHIQLGESLDGLGSS